MSPKLGRGHSIIDKEDPGLQINGDDHQRTLNNNYIKENLRISTNSDIMLKNAYKSRTQVIEDEDDEEFKVPINREVQPMMMNKSRISGHHI